MRLFPTSIVLLSVFERSVQACRNDPDRCDSICRNEPDLIPHQAGLWEADLPASNGLNMALCEGNIEVSEDGEICVDGRVNYEQLSKFVKNSAQFSESHNVFAPAASSISVTGHLVSGSSNLIYGPSANFLYDFVTSYIVNGTTYSADETMIDKLLAASMGTIDGVCFNSNFVQSESYYEISHKAWSPDEVNVNEITDTSIVFASSFSVVGEYHKDVEAPNFFETAIGNARMFSFNTVTRFPTPDIVYQFVPVFQFSGTLRRLIVGTVKLSTDLFPNPVSAPDVAVENIQLDMEWSAFVTLVGNGIFKNMPSKMSALIKKITPNESSNGCWDVPVASLDFQIPLGFSDDLDEYVTDVFYPAILDLDEDAEVSLHFGKRMPSGGVVLQAALDKYESCGATLDLSPEKCYHPLCTRTNVPTTFEYPEKYYDKYEPLIEFPWSN